MKKTKTIGPPSYRGQIQGKNRLRSSSVAYTIYLQEAVSSLLSVDVWYLFHIEQHEGQSEPFNYVVVKSKYFIVSTDYWKEAVNLSVSCNKLATYFSTFLNAKKGIKLTF